MIRRATWWVAAFAATFALWLLCVDQAAFHEAIAGCGAAALGATVSELARGEEHPRFWPHLSYFVELWRIPLEVAGGCVLLAECLVHRRRGVLRRAPFHVGGQDRRSATRRALAVAFGSIAPNSIVIGIDQKSSRMLVHFAHRAPLPEIVRRLGAQP
jgi:hypothetical protein